MTDLARRTARAEIAALAYEGVDSIRDAATLRERMAATVDLARRARLDAREHMWNAREAERALGRMILAAREAGDLATRGGSNVDLPDIDSLGISRDLAAHAVALAKLPDDVWSAWHEQDRDPTQTAIGRAVREYEARLNRVAAEADGRRQTERRLREQRAEIERQLTELAERVSPGAEVPPLRDDETDVSAVEFVAPATAVEEPVDDRDRERGDAWVSVLRDLERVVTALDRKPPALPRDRFADLTVLSARDLARRITNAAALWLRDVNTAYDERIGRP